MPSLQWPSAGAQRMAISSQPSAISKSGLRTEHFPTQSSALVTNCSLRASPPGPKPERDEGERDVRPWASNVQLQIFTNLLPAAGGSLPEES